MTTGPNDADRKAARPRNSRATKELLLAAATAEFAQYGLAGARIDRIAERAGANKRLLYVYFGDKDQLFEAVLQHEIGRLFEEASLAGGDLVAFAGNRFDYMLAHPDTARLAAWRRFERDRHTDAEIDSYRVKVDAVAAAQREGRTDASLPAIDLFAMVLRITESWLDAPPALQALTGTDPRSAERLAEHRAALIEAVRRITAPRTGPEGDDAPRR
ncbi:transcriptional regulator, TetR family [Actinacidiphila yanglinensis]|uniref:Transcriptional regulator, TetR family n=1 Tax=Actinacidiphila yanglinensis TaxID=310779 RepID=A0A1H6D7C4_9ACTN|nr:TetR family transcriptional regulator [Actinacidiphila yanglinensis]SEG80984.1 transcriptional regulator, TetR family [Actinacidiphila yanglinensis]